MVPCRGSIPPSSRMKLDGVSFRVFFFFFIFFSHSLPSSLSPPMMSPFSLPFCWPEELDGARVHLELVRLVALLAFSTCEGTLRCVQVMCWQFAFKDELQARLSTPRTTNRAPGHTFRTSCTVGRVELTCWQFACKHGFPPTCTMSPFCIVSRLEKIIAVGKTIYISGRDGLLPKHGKRKEEK